jgi:hypothetical protein
VARFSGLASQPRQATGNRPWGRFWR